MITRRGFLQLSGLFGLAAAAPLKWHAAPPPEEDGWPRLTLAALPQCQRAVLQRMSRLEVDPAGYLHQFPTQFNSTPLPLHPTQWNQEHATLSDKLQSGFPWAIVLHWFGDDDKARKSVSMYLNGFNGLQRFEDYEARTSAHCLVGTAHPANAEGGIGILQTQRPYADGTPLVASHLQDLDYEGHKEREQYFVRALYQLNKQEAGVHSVLQDWFDGQPVDPNMRSLAIELTGRELDSPGSYAPDQQVANTLATVSALMQRYQVQGSNLLGHLEIATNKADPGKQLMALVRCLLGVYALTAGEPGLRTLVFGQYLGEEGDARRAVRAYFKFGRDFLMLTGLPKQVYEWESRSGYWGLVDQLPGYAQPILPPARAFQHPLPGARAVDGAVFLNPHNHAGVDLYLPAPSRRATAEVVLSAAGQCLYAGPARFHHPGMQVIFRHRQPDGAEVLSLYQNLSTLAALQPGELYPAGTPLGQLGADASQTFVLHFGMAYGSSWELDLEKNPYVPLNASVTWIRQRFMDPLQYVSALTR